VNAAVQWLLLMRFREKPAELFRIKALRYLAVIALLRRRARSKWNFDAKLRRDKVAYSQCKAADAMSIFWKQCDGILMQFEAFERLTKFSCLVPRSRQSGIEPIEHYKAESDATLHL
jgi:hypothetical protein